MSRRVFLTISLLILSLCGYAQQTDIEQLVEEGIALHDEGRYAQAIEVYKRALAIDPRSSLVNYEISFSYLLAKDYKNAEKYSKKVIDLNDGHLLEGYINYGSALDYQGKTKKSIKVYEKAIRQFDNYLLYYNHAVSCFNHGDADKAYESAVMAISNNPTHASSHWVLSQVMDQQGVRIKAMLPLYFFLLIEPNSARSAAVYQKLLSYAGQGITKSSEKNINVVVPANSDPDFGAAEMMISLTNVASATVELPGKSELQVFAENNEHLFKILGELKKENTGFWWDFYVTFFYDLANENLTEIYSYYISQSQSEEVIRWLDEHPGEFKKFEQWMSK